MWHTLHRGPNNRFVGIGTISSKLTDHAWINIHQYRANDQTCKKPQPPRPAVISSRLVSVSNCGLAGIYFLVRAIFVASKLWIWQQFNFLVGRHLNYIFIDSLYHLLALMDYNPRINETRISLFWFPIPSRAPVPGLFVPESGSL